jgi:leucyl aminopeptidase
MTDLTTLLADEHEHAIPLHVVDAAGLEGAATAIGASASAWIESTRYRAAPGSHLLVPGPAGELAGVIAAAPERRDPFGPLALGRLSRTLPAATYRLSGLDGPERLAVLGWLLGAYRFTSCREADGSCDLARLVLPEGVDRAESVRIAAGCHRAMELVNLPANDLGPAALAAAARSLAEAHGASVTETVGDDLIEAGLPLIHAVGRASAEAPRLVDFTWGDPEAPKLTLVGKGVTFDTGGLDLKPASSMLLMKKDMGGAANILGLAQMIMDAGLGLRLRVLLPIVENAVSGASFRPGDVLPSRKGPNVEIGNTDAEGRLILADALALGDEEAPDLIIDMATLTGAARVALGPDLPPFYTHDDALAGALARHAAAEADPLWRLPLWPPYDEWVNAKVGDISNAPDKPFAGSITAALFLSRFVENARAHLHIDVYAWTPQAKPHAPRGGAAQGIRALYAMIRESYGA